MPLVLPPSHPSFASLGGTRASSGSAPLRIGVINVMPRAEAYEPMLLAPLARAPFDIAPVFVRLHRHAYKSSDKAHLERYYVSFDEAMKTPLDGLILTGAPVEELPFEDVTYWSELTETIDRARRRIPSTLGLCWGGLALAAMVGVPKVVFRKKLFGAFGGSWLVDSHSLRARGQRGFSCAQSRHSGADEAALERAGQDGRVRLLVRGDATGHTLFETPDHRLVMHLGHPEYEASRIAFEWKRDQGTRADVDAPVGVDPAQPVTSWHEDREAFFRGWLTSLRRPVVHHADTR